MNMPDINMAEPRQSRWDTEPLGPEEIQILEDADDNPAAVITSTRASSKLGLFSTCCMIINRMIGTGIFSTPATILKATDSAGAALLLWAIGSLISWSGLMVYIEFGLSIPRYQGADGIKRAVPRSGGEKNYLEYVYRAPKFLATCIFGVVFIVLGNTAGNAISFAQYILRTRGYDQEELKHPSEDVEWLIKAVAVSAITGACLLHGSWRAGGIFVNNFFATVKFCLLLVSIVAGFAFSAGVRPRNEPRIQSPKNLGPAVSFDASIGGGGLGKVYAYSQSLLLIIFAYSGYENANYILSEIDRPKRTFKWASMLSLGLVSLLYMLANITYFLVVDKEDFKKQDTQLAITYFYNIFGDSKGVLNVVAGLIAFSSFGNIIVVTFVSSRVKQEIAKEGVLPWSRIIASDMQTPFSWLRSRLRGAANVSKSDEENTPIAALFLHWLFSVILVISPNIGDAYQILLLLHSYALQVWVGFFLGAGLVYLYLKPGSTWGSKSGFTPIGGWVWAAFFTLVNLFLIITPWIPPPGTVQLVLENTAFYVYPTVSVSLVAFGVLYWVAFAKIYPRIIKKELKVNRVPIIQRGVQIYEAVFFNWVVPDDGSGSEEVLDGFPDRTEDFGNQPAGNQPQQADSKEIGLGNP